MAGRPTKLTPELIAHLTEAIRAGMPLKLAAVYAGISYDTLNEWRHHRFPKSAPVELRNLFSDALKRAEADLMYELLVSIKLHAETDAPGDWRAAARILERRYPQHFGRGKT